MIEDFILPLIMTLALEVPIAALWGLRGRDLGLCVLVNLLTNPLANLLHLFWPTLVGVAVIECAVVAGEWRLYRSCGDHIRRPLLFSLTANLTSVMLGYFILQFILAYFIPLFI